MSSLELQVPPRKALEVVAASSPGSYSVEFPPVLCFGNVVQGGLVTGATQHAAVDLLKRLPKTTKHCHTQQLAVSYFRPTLPSPSKTIINVRVANSNKAWTTVHVEVQQNGKSCMAGYLTLTDLSMPGKLTVDTRWVPLPPPLAVNLQALENGNDPNWVNYRIPFEATKVRKAHSYMQFYIPTRMQKPNMVEQWVTPCWKDEERFPHGARWTNDILEFAMDNCFPTLIYLVMSRDNKHTQFHEKVVRAGREQSRARAEGRSDAFVGQGLGDDDLAPVIESTISAFTEVKKLLPEEGIKWLYLQVMTRRLLNDKTDNEIVALDQDGDLVAISHHTMQAISMAQKQAPRKAVL